MKQRVEWISGVFLFGVAVGVVAVQVIQPAAANGDTVDVSRLPTVRTDVATRSGARSPSRFSSTVRSKDRAELSFTLAGRVIARAVDVGAPVRAGQVLVRIDPQPFVHQVKGLEARLSLLDSELAQLKRDLSRAERLHASEALGIESVERVRAGHDAKAFQKDAVVAQLAEARRLNRESVLRAPFDGTVSSVRIQTGEYARPGVPVVSVSGLRDLEAEFQLPEPLRDQLTLGQAVNVEFVEGSTKKTLNGRVRNVGRATSGSGQLFPVVVAFEDATLVPGLTVEVLVEPSRENPLTVPIAAISSPVGQQAFVFRVVDEKVDRIGVKLGELLGRRVAVDGPLKAGDAVIIAGHAALIHGEAVQVVP